MPNRQQQNIYIQNFIRARNYAFSPGHSEMIGRLCAVEGALTQRKSIEDGVAGFCEELMAVFRNTHGGQQGLLYSKIDRICLAAQVGVSNELIVLDSYNGERANANTMSPLYRCFVRANSSLFHLREGEIRIYDDASRVADTFEHKKKPIQRSLAYVMKMGFKSGLTVPLHAAGRLRGFLFLNSVEEGLFSQFADEDYALLNIIAMLAKQAVLSEAQVDSGYESFAQQEFPVFSGQLFDDEELLRQIQSLVKWQEDSVWRPEIALSGRTDFLYSPANLAYVIAKVCFVLYEGPSRYPNRIEVCNREDGSVLINIPSPDLGLKLSSLTAYQSRVKLINSYTKSLRISVSAGINQVSLKFPYDPVGSQREDELYSVS